MIPSTVRCPWVTSPVPWRIACSRYATFAIVLTLLVLEIHRPSAAPGQLAQGLAREWPSAWRT